MIAGWVFLDRVCVFFTFVDRLGVEVIMGPCTPASPFAVKKAHVAPYTCPNEVNAAYLAPHTKQERSV